MTIGIITPYDQEASATGEIFVTYAIREGLPPKSDQLGAWVPDVPIAHPAQTRPIVNRMPRFRNNREHDRIDAGNAALRSRRY